jgi:cell division protein FtsW
MLFGPEINGAHRWLRLGPKSLGVSFQPSELLKLSLVMFLAGWFGRGERNPRKLTTILPAVGLIILCVGMVAKEDLGTAAVIGLASVMVLLMAGMSWYYLAVLLPFAAAGLWLAIEAEPYRLQRVTAFLDVWRGVQTEATYQPRQALIAIGSGGMWGKGLGNGTVKLGFLPEDNTDYIFSVICEELGFAGAAIVLGLAATLLYLSWRASVKADDKPGRLLAGGLGLLIAVQVVGHALRCTSGAVLSSCGAERSDSISTTSKRRTSTGSHSGAARGRAGATRCASTSAT